MTGIEYAVFFVYTDGMFDDCVIMAGGSGTRLWPASSSRLPKQFLPVSGKTSFFTLALERALAVTCANGRIIIITGKSHINRVIAETAKLNLNDKKRIVIIGEPVAKNTAPAIACAIAFSRLTGKNRKMLVLTSDHIIKPLKIFKANAALAADSAVQGKLAVFGIPPSRAETGYGYVETDSSERGVFNVTAFHEKPDLETAAKYITSGNYFWNSGMFAFCTDFMADEFRRLSPDAFLPFEKLKAVKSSFYTVLKGVKTLTAWSGLDNAYKKVKNISFDYAVVEKCSKTVMVRSEFDWIDIGNWEEYVKFRGTSGKATRGNNNSQVFSVSSENCFVDSDIPVALVGVENLIVVIRTGKNDAPAALVTKMGQTQKVREITKKLKKAGKTELL